MSYLKSNGEAIGIPLLFLGILLIVVAAILSWMAIEVLPLVLVGLALASFSVALGLIAVGMAAKSDKRHTELLERLEKSIALLPNMFKDDILTPSGQLVAKTEAQRIASEPSKEAAQKRLDEDTERVGYVRGEIHQNEDGNWVIHWGGKYPL